VTRWWRLGHRWLGILAAAVILMSAITGWLMLHDSWLEGRDFKAVAADPHDVRHLLASGPQGLWRSSDGGVTWTEVTMPVPTTHVTALSAGGQGFAVALRDFGVWTSPDGYLWDRVTDTPEGERIKSLSFQNGKLVLLTEAAMIVDSRRFEQSRSMLRQIHDWHTGWAFGRPGTLAVEAGALSLMVLTVTGLVLAWRTRRRRRPAAGKPLAPTTDAADRQPVANL
jgi:uncharacterized iron-regulated membrane protein